MMCKKKLIWICSLIVAVVLCGGIFLHLILAPRELQPSGDRRIPIEKIATSMILDKDVILSDAELESLVAQVLPLDWNEFSLRSDLAKEKFHLCIRVPYKKKKFFVSMDVLPEITGENIVLRFSDAHIGRLPVPVSFVLKRMESITVSGDSIIIPNSWCFDIRGLTTKVHIKNFEKISGGNTSVRFQAKISIK